MAFAAVLHIVDPSEATSFPICPFYAVTGMYCPGCGTLRCLHALLHLDLRSALDYNALTVLFVPMLVIAWLSLGLAAIRGREPPPDVEHPPVGRLGRRCRLRTVLAPAEPAGGALLLDGAVIGSRRIAKGALLGWRCAGVAHAGVAQW